MNNESEARSYECIICEANGFYKKGKKVICEANGFYKKGKKAICEANGFYKTTN